MKKLIISLLFICLIPTIAFGLTYTVDYKATGTEYKSLRYMVALATTNSKKCTIYLPHNSNSDQTTYTLANVDCNIPDYVSLDVANGAKLNLTGSGNVYIYKMGNVGNSQHWIDLDSTGKVYFREGSIKEVFAEWWGGKGDGSTDDYTPFLAAVTVYKNLALIPNSTYMIKSSVTIPDRVTNIYGNDATLITDSNHPIFLHTYHGKLLTVKDATFDGTAPGVKFLAAVSGTQYYDFHIENCKFVEDTGVYGIHLDGGREGNISKCYFETCDGIYRTRTCNTYITNCQWKNTAYGINDDGDNTAYSCGLCVIGATALGCTTWLRSYDTDDTSVYHSMIDYCDNPIILKGVDESRISSNRLSGRSTSPDIYIADSNTPISCYNPIITGNTLVQYSTDDVDDIYISNAIKPIISNNNITFYTRYGIYFEGCTYLKIANNMITPRNTYGNFSVYTTDVISNAVELTYNTLEQDPNVRQYLTKIIGNTGYTTEAKGETVLTAYTSTVTVAHGCEYLPKKQDIIVTPTHSMGLASTFWINSVDATNIVINVDRDPNSNISFAWQVNKISGY